MSWKKSNPLILIKIIQISLLIDIIFAASQFLDVPKNSTIYETQSVKFNCKSSMQEQHEYTWLLNGNQIHPSPRILQMDSNLIILKTIKSIDAGEYVCIATSYLTGAREATPSAYLKIIGNDDLDSSLIRGKRGDSKTKTDNFPIINIRENSFAQLQCNFLHKVKLRQIPQLTVRWEKDGKLIREVLINKNSNLLPSNGLTSDNNMENSFLTDESRVYINRKNGSLIFSSTTASDEGFYICQVLSDGIEPIILNQTSLKIIEILKFAPQPTSKNLELGSVGKVHCRAQGTPNPHVKWIRDNEGIASDSIEDRNGTLIFKNVTTDHTGNYTCMALNSQGEITATISITVVVAPKYSVFSTGPINVSEMGNTMLHCQATGDPEPTIQWDKDLVYLNNNETEDSRFKILDNGTLVILRAHLEDEGQYGCTIGNSAGLKREEIQVVVKPAEIFNTEEQSDGFVITLTVLILMSIAFAYIIFVVALLAWGKYKRSKNRARLTIMSKQTEETCDDDNNMDKEIDPCLIEKCERISPKSNSKNSNHRSHDGISDPNVSATNSKTSKRTINTNYEIISKSDLTQVYQLGRGCFGDLLIMKFNYNTEKRKSNTSLNDTDEIKIEKTNPEITVLVKTIKRTKDENIGIEFKRQLDMFGNINHDNVSKLYGLCQDDSLHGMVLEWTDWGDFKQFLIATTKQDDAGSTKSKSTPLKMAQMLTAAHQISKGLDAIYRARFIHKDVAARNCIISSNFCVKISYSALSKDKYSNEYYKQSDELIPLRWMAPECLQDADYSIKSDVYSFGVLAWEIFTHSTQIPLDTISNEEFLHGLKDNTLDRTLAENTPENLTDILTTCWNRNPKERPSFSQIITSLGNSLNNEYSKTKTES